jgi:hypothetical protein
MVMGGIGMLTVGQELWFVPHPDRARGTPHAVTVTKVGRKWAEIDNGKWRISVATLAVDGAGYNAPARCYVSREAYEAEQERQALWRALWRHLEHKYVAPDDLCIEQIKVAAMALGVSVP